MSKLTSSKLRSTVGHKIRGLWATLLLGLVLVGGAAIGAMNGVESDAPTLEFMSRVVLALLAVACGVLTWRLSRRIASGVGALATGIESIEAGDMEYRPEPGGPIGEVAEAVPSAPARRQQAPEDDVVVRTARQQVASTVSSVTESDHDPANSTDHGAPGSNAGNSVHEDLVDASSQVSRVTDSISRITDRTHLDALNTIIETTGAGEANRGSKVVRVEDKVLAQEMVRATGSIDDQVRDLDCRSEQVANAIQEIDRVIRSVNDLAGTLAAVVEGQDSLTREVKTSGSTASDLDTVSRSDEDANSAARGVYDAAEQLNRLANQLRDVQSEDK